DPVSREAGFLAEVEHPTFGRHRRLAPLVHLARTPGACGPAPTLGMHTEAILGGLGYEAPARAALAPRGVIPSPASAPPRAPDPAPRGLAATGHPLHTRALAVELRQRADGKMDIRGYVLDLRKRGFVPVAGDLQPSGIVHHMELFGVVDPATLVVETLTSRQPSVAFEATATTEGESCRDLAGRVDALGGTRLDVEWSRRLSAEIGGPRGCSHVLTLAQMLGPTVAWGIAHDRELHGPNAQRPTGQRIFRRDIIVDGLEPEDGRLELAVQLIDLYDAPAPELARPLARFGGALEVRAQILVDYRTYSITGLMAAERWRGRDNLDASWEDRTDDVSGLCGTFLHRGVTAAILQH